MCPTLNFNFPAGIPATCWPRKDWFDNVNMLAFGYSRPALDSQLNGLLGGSHTIFAHTANNSLNPDFTRPEGEYHAQIGRRSNPDPAQAYPTYNLTNAGKKWIFGGNIPIAADMISKGAAVSGTATWTIAHSRGHGTNFGFAERRPPGANSLWLDGHVQWNAMPRDLVVPLDYRTQLGPGNNSTQEQFTRTDWANGTYLHYFWGKSGR